MIYQIYKKILYYMPASIYTKLNYYKVFKRKLKLKNPQTLNEKLQWAKLYDKKDIYTLCSDKYSVREYIKGKIGEKYLIPLLFHTDKPEEIPFYKLQLPYIIKSNHCSGHTIIIRDKKDIDQKKIIKECKKWLKVNYYKVGKEWNYKNIKPQIIIEKLMLDEKGKIPKDYKFHCFNGKIGFINVHSNRFGNHKETYLDRNWKFLPFIWCIKVNGKPEHQIKKDIPKPKNLRDMIRIAEKISKPFDYIRIDLYSIKNKIYFGEFTFHHGGGFSHFFPDKWDLIWGKKLNLKNFNKKTNRKI